MSSRAGKSDFSLDGLPRNPQNQLPDFMDMLRAGQRPAFAPVVIGQLPFNNFGVPMAMPVAVPMGMQIPMAIPAPVPMGMGMAIPARPIVGCGNGYVDINGLRYGIPCGNIIDVKIDEMMRTVKVYIQTIPFNIVQKVKIRY